MFHNIGWHNNVNDLYMKRKVLIIDDETDECFLISAFLTRKNYEVKYAHTLLDGIIKLESEKPDVLLLDNNLPDGLGWSKADEIKKQFPAIQITLISAHENASHSTIADSSEFRKLEKPISFQTLEKYLE